MDVYKGKGTLIVKSRRTIWNYQDVEPIRIAMNYESVAPDKYLYEKCTDLISVIINGLDDSASRVILKNGNLPNYDFNSTPRVLSPLVLHNMILRDSSKTCCNIVKLRFNRALAFCIVIHYIGSEDDIRESIDLFIFGKRERLNVPFSNSKIELVYKSFIHTYRFNSIAVRFHDIFSSP